jgi:hypothetical protein
VSYMSGFSGGRLLSDKLATEERRRSPAESPSPTRLAIEDRHRLPVHITSYHNSTTSASPRLVTPSLRVSTTGRVGRSSGAAVAEAAAARVAAAVADVAQSVAAEAAATAVGIDLWQQQQRQKTQQESCVKHTGLPLSRSCTKSARDVPPAAELTKRSVASDAVCGSELASYLQENDLLFLVSDLESRYPSQCVSPEEDEDNAWEAPIYTSQPDLHSAASTQRSYLQSQPVAAPPTGHGKSLAGTAVAHDRQQEEEPQAQLPSPKDCGGIERHRVRTQSPPHCNSARGMTRDVPLRAAASYSDCSVGGEVGGTTLGVPPRVAVKKLASISGGGEVGLAKLMEARRKAQEMSTDEGYYF